MKNNGSQSRREDMIIEDVDRKITKLRRGNKSNVSRLCHPFGVLNALGPAYSIILSPLRGCKVSWLAELMPAVVNNRNTNVVGDHQLAGAGNTDHGQRPNNCRHINNRRVNTNFKQVASLAIALVIVTATQSAAQLSISGQYRARTELRNGQGTPSVNDTAAAFFVSQRTRVNVGFTAHRIKFYTSIQDVRVWGQDASTVNRTTADVNDGLMLHEAWAELSLLDTGRAIKTFVLKTGRQELVYDDVRLLGNLDWLQQARRHDAILLKLEHKGWMAHAGAAFNQNAERKSNTIYNGVPTGYVAGTNGIGSMYKSMQFLYVGRKQKWGSASFLLFKDDFSKFHFATQDSLKKAPIYESGVWSRLTTGLYVSGTAFWKLAFNGSAYYQGGHYRDGTALNEYLLSLSAQYGFTPRLSIGPGADITSGNNGTDPSKKYQRFDPLYGTPHKFWGYMDYFYVADGFGPNGLVDVYLKTRHKASDKLTLFLDLHNFALPEAVMNESGAAMKKTLGTEIDLTFNYQVTKAAVVEGGACYFIGTPTLTSAAVKNVRNPNSSSSWAYVMLTLKPDFISK